MSRRFALCTLALIILVGLGLRSYQITARSLWFDEAFSWRLVSFPVTEMIARAIQDVHPPLYYFLLKGYATVFGNSLLSLRSFSVVFAGITIAAGYLFAAYAFRSRFAGLLAAAFVAVSGWQIAFAWEARMYTLGTALAFLSSWALLKGVRRPAWGIWIIYAVLATAFAYTHYFAFFTLAAHAVFVAGYILVKTRARVGEILGWRLTWQALAAALLFIALYAPWIPVFLRQNMQVQSSYWVPEVTAWSIPETVYRFYIPTTKPISREGASVIPALLPLVATGLALLWFAFSRQHKDANWLVTLAVFIPFAITILVSFIGQSLYQDRFLVFANLFVLVAAAALISRIPWTWPRRSLAVFAIVGLSGTFLNYWLELDIPNKPGVRAAAAAIAAEGAALEPVVVSSSFIYFSVNYYFTHDFSRPEPRLLSDTAELIHFAGGPILKISDIITPAGVSQISADTLWVVDTSGFGGTKASLGADWRAVSEKVFPEVFPHQGEIFVTKYQRVL